VFAYNGEQAVKEV
jgi:CheY-like chemotaxis protein